MGVVCLNKDAAFFASMFVAAIALLSSFFVYSWYGFKSASITVLAAIIWVGIGLLYKNSK